MHIETALPLLGGERQALQWMGVMGNVFQRQSDAGEMILTPARRDRVLAAILRRAYATSRGMDIATWRGSHPIYRMQREEEFETAFIASLDQLVAFFTQAIERQEHAGTEQLILLDARPSPQAVPTLDPT